MFSQIKPAILMTIVLTLITGIAYPLAVTGLSLAMLHHRASGSLLTRNGKVVGSEWIAQNFTKPEYFHPRPSAASANGYDATASSGSNLGPSNPDLAKRLVKDAAAYRAENHFTGAIPADAITTSGSGLDPEISPANALIQAGRVAMARGASQDGVRDLLRAHTEGRQFGFLGEPRVNVLKLNLVLDERFPAKK